MPHISAINGIPISNIATVNGVARESIASYNGMNISNFGFISRNPWQDIILVQHTKTKLITYNFYSEQENVTYDVSVPAGFGDWVPQTYDEFFNNVAPVVNNRATFSFYYVAPVSVPSPVTQDITITVGNGIVTETIPLSIRVY